MCQDLGPYFASKLYYPLNFKLFSHFSAFLSNHSYPWSTRDKERGQREKTVANKLSIHSIHSIQVQERLAETILWALFW